MRLAEDIALLERAAAIAGQAIWPQADNVTVPPRTFDALLEEVEQRRASPADYRLIRDEAVWLLQAAKNVALYRADDNAPMLERWMRLAELVRAGVELDLHNAKKSIGALA